MGAASIRHSLRPPFSEGEALQDSGKTCRGNAKLRLLGFVIASQRVRAKRGPMTGSAKQSMLDQIWIASSRCSSQ